MVNHLPIDRFFKLLLQILVSQLEVVAPEESAIGAQRAGMRTNQNQMLASVDLRHLLLRFFAPEHENDAVQVPVDDLDDSIGERLPA